ncbi:hypothetical protein ACF05L_08810 [Streptomyces bobili]|uniref:hypothetical protein n=1 Tax=Streptomyces bobili TaxID=67280 RepID=UPI00370250F7
MPHVVGRHLGQDPVGHDGPAVLGRGDGEPYRHGGVADVVRQPYREARERVLGTARRLLGAPLSHADPYDGRVRAPEVGGRPPHADGRVHVRLCAGRSPAGERAP